MTGALAGLALGVLAGSVPFSWVLHRLRTGGDLRTEGSGNPGATNLLRVAGIGWGLAGLALDAGKGAAAVLLASRAGGEPAAVAAAVAAVFAHVFSPWLGGAGGKGVATAAGAFAVLAPFAFAVAAVVFLLVVATTRLVAAGSLAAAATLVIAAFVFGSDRLVAVAALVIAVLVAWRHRENFARMRAGIEPRLGSRGDSR